LIDNFIGDSFTWNFREFHTKLNFTVLTAILTTDVITSLENTYGIEEIKKFNRWFRKIYEKRTS